MGDHREIDPYKYFRRQFGGENAALLSFLRQRLGQPDDPYTGAAGKLIRRQINESFDAKRQASLRDLTGRGMAAGGRRNRLLADIEGTRGQALSDALSNLTIQRETQIPQLLANYLSALNRAPIVISKGKKGGMGAGLGSALGMGLGAIAGGMVGGPPGAGIGAGIGGGIGGGVGSAADSAMGGGPSQVSTPSIPTQGGRQQYQGVTLNPMNWWENLLKMLAGNPQGGSMQREKR